MRINNASLHLKLGYASGTNTSYRLIKNAGNDAVIGTFAGLPAGGTFTVSGAQFQITYQGGDGNDVVVRQLTTSTQSFDVRLDIQPVPGTNQAVLSWPTFAPDHRLMRCPDLTGNVWFQDPGFRAVLGDRFRQTVTTTNGTQLFRLEKPQN